MIQSSVGQRNRCSEVEPRQDSLMSLLGWVSKVMWLWLLLISLTICFEGDDVTCWLCFCEEKQGSKQVLRSAEKSFKEIYPPIVPDSHYNKWGTDFSVCS